MRQYSPLFLRLCILLFMGVLILFPARSAEGAAAGLLLWYRHVLPVLLPFLILCRLMQAFRKDRPGQTLPVICLGLLCGYPVGAGLAAGLCRSRKDLRPRAAWLLSFCNQASPMFLFGYLAAMLPPLSHPALLIGIGIYGSALLPGLAGALRLRRKTAVTAGPLIRAGHAGGKPSALDPAVSAPFLPILEDAMLSSVETLVKIGVYMMLFSIAACHLTALPFSAPILKALLLSLNEMTTGIAFLAESALPLRLRCSIQIASAAFGGFCGFAQTTCVLQGSGLSARRYLAAKALQGILAFLITWTLFPLL